MDILKGLAGRKCPTCGGCGKVQDAAQVGARFRALREERGLTLREVARRAGFSAAYVSDVELGRRGCKSTLIQKLINALKNE